MLGKEGRKTGAADLLLALDQHGDARWQAAMHLQPGAEGFQPELGLALIVHRAARDQAAAMRAVNLDRLKGWAGPEIQGVGGLHVIMAVEEQMRCLRARCVMMREHDWMARRLMDRGPEAKALQFSLQPRRGAPAVASMVGLGTDARNAQQGEEALARFIEMAIDMVKQRVEMRHRLRLL